MDGGPREMRFLEEEEPHMMECLQKPRLRSQILMQRSTPLLTAFWDSIGLHSTHSTYSK